MNQTIGQNVNIVAFYGDAIREDLLSQGKWILHKTISELNIQQLRVVGLWKFYNKRLTCFYLPKFILSYILDDFNGSTLRI